MASADGFDLIRDGDSLDSRSLDAAIDDFLASAPLTIRDSIPRDEAARIKARVLSDFLVKKNAKPNFVPIDFQERPTAAYVSTPALGEEESYTVPQFEKDSLEPVFDSARDAFMAQNLAAADREGLPAWRQEMIGLSHRQGVIAEAQERLMAAIETACPEIDFKTWSLSDHLVSPPIFDAWAEKERQRSFRLPKTVKEATAKIPLPTLPETEAKLDKMVHAVSVEVVKLLNAPLEHWSIRRLTPALLALTVGTQSVVENLSKPRSTALDVYRTQMALAPEVIDPEVLLQTRLSAAEARLGLETFEPFETSVMLPEGLDRLPVLDYVLDPANESLLREVRKPGGILPKIVPVGGRVHTRLEYANQRRDNLDAYMRDFMQRRGNWLTNIPNSGKRAEYASQGFETLDIEDSVADGTLVRFHDPNNPNAYCFQSQGIYGGFGDGAGNNPKFKVTRPTTLAVIKNQVCPKFDEVLERGGWPADIPKPDPVASSAIRARLPGNGTLYGGHSGGISLDFKDAFSLWDASSTHQLITRERDVNAALSFYRRNTKSLLGGVRKSREEYGTLLYQSIDLRDARLQERETLMADIPRLSDEIDHAFNFRNRNGYQAHSDVVDQWKIAKARLPQVEMELAFLDARITALDGEVTKIDQTIQLFTDVEDSLLGLLILMRQLFFVKEVTFKEVMDANHLIIINREKSPPHDHFNVFMSEEEYQIWQKFLAMEDEAVENMGLPKRPTDLRRPPSYQNYTFRK